MSLIYRCFSTRDYIAVFYFLDILAAVLLAQFLGSNIAQEESLETGNNQANFYAHNDL